MKRTILFFTTLMFAANGMASGAGSGMTKLPEPDKTAPMTLFEALQNRQSVREFSEKNIGYKFNYIKQMIYQFTDTKEWDLMEIMNEKHLYYIKTTEDEHVKIIFAERRLEESKDLVRIERVIKEFSTDNIPFNINAMFKPHKP